MKSLMHQAKQHRRWKRRQIWSWDGDGWEREPIPARHFFLGGGMMVLSLLWRDAECRGRQLWSCNHCPELL